MIFPTFSANTATHYLVTILKICSSTFALTDTNLSTIFLFYQPSASYQYSTCVYPPKSLLTAEHLFQWLALADPVDGLHITATSTLAAFKKEIQTPGDLFGVSSSDIDAINTTHVDLHER
jgi:hypothetical protein